MIKRRVYTKEFKIEAVELTLDSTKTVKEISDELGAPYQLLCK
ncbi:transposase, partial [Thermodesulfovibrio thiophilus]